MQNNEMVTTELTKMASTNLVQICQCDINSEHVLIKYDIRMILKHEQGAYRFCQDNMD